MLPALPIRHVGKATRMMKRFSPLELDYALRFSQSRA
jgi:hypothetical protein